MAGLSQNIELQLFSKTPLLVTESEQDFSVLSAALMQEIKPHGIVQQLYLADFVTRVWEILRVQRCKVAIVNTAFKDALSEIVYRLAGEPEMGTPELEWVDRVCLDWFSKPEVRKEVLQLLAEFRLVDIEVLAAVGQTDWRGERRPKRAAWELTGQLNGGLPGIRRKS